MRGQVHTHISRSPTAARRLRGHELGRRGAGSRWPFGVYGSLESRVADFSFSYEQEVSPARHVNPRGALARWPPGLGRCPPPASTAEPRSLFGPSPDYSRGRGVVPSGVRLGDASNHRDYQPSLYLTYRAEAPRAEVRARPRRPQHVLTFGADLRRGGVGGSRSPSGHRRCYRALPPLAAVARPPPGPSCPAVPCSAFPTPHVKTAA